MICWYWLPEGLKGLTNKNICNQNANKKKATLVVYLIIREIDCIKMCIV